MTITTPPSMGQGQASHDQPTSFPRSEDPASMIFINVSFAPTTPPQTPTDWTPLPLPTRVPGVEITAAHPTESPTKVAVKVGDNPSFFIATQEKPQSVKRAECPRCGNTFAGAQKLKRHQRSGACERQGAETSPEVREERNGVWRRFCPFCDNTGTYKTRNSAVVAVRRHYKVRHPERDLGDKRRKRTNGMIPGREGDGGGGSDERLLSPDGERELEYYNNMLQDGYDGTALEVSGESGAGMG
ncbi:hypothetical protein L873DRAFT_1717972 [Choiromyces venosus 120613-1]|uniref:C2H2-type domain-containing protein n=1 Tax=Choiromyces venosus 120613-1 TaxID=1336337 RepID=A0A3N4IWQ7_9PEZI|nr:hypothetical protein L873DRAFT_1717972 [Choiromyces venosus 120613-1]